MTLFDILPSLKAVTVNRSFDTGSWGAAVRAHGTDITIGGHSVVREFARRKDAFYLDADGLPTCQELCPADVVFPILATRLVSVIRTSSDHVECRIAARVPITASIVDVAFPSTSLAGARLIDFTLIDESGHRRTIHAEGPPRIGPGTPVLLALTAVTSQIPAPAVRPGRPRSRVRSPQ